MRKLVLFLMVCLMSLGGLAQTLCIEKSVEILPTSIYASRNQRKDAKGLPCGVVIFHSTIDGLKFKGDVVGEVQYEAGVYYVYLPATTKKIEAVAPSGSTLKIDLPKIEAKTTYEATLYYVFPKGSLACASDPSGATVTLISGGERTNVGRTPLKGNNEVLVGIYDVEFSKQGYKSIVKRNVKVNAQKTTKLGTIKLAN